MRLQNNRIIVFLIFISLFMIRHAHAIDDKRVTIDYPYINFESLISNLKTDTPENPRYIRLKMALKVKSEADIQTVEYKIPEILDRYYMVITDTTIYDLRGSQEVQQLKGKLLSEFNKILTPVTLEDLLFQEILMQ